MHPSRVDFFAPCISVVNFLDGKRLLGVIASPVTFFSLPPTGLVLIWQTVKYCVASTMYNTAECNLQSRQACCGWCGYRTGLRSAVKLSKGGTMAEPCLRHDRTMS